MTCTSLSTRTRSVRSECGLLRCFCLGTSGISAKFLFGFLCASGSLDGTTPGQPRFQTLPCRTVRHDLHDSNKESLMNRLWCVTAGLALLAGGTMVLTLSGAKEKKPPSIKAIMTKAHKGENSLIRKVGKDLKEDEPNWADVQKKT